jgi:hypothetical protein
MTEIFIVLGLFAALVWAIVRAVLMLVHLDEPDGSAATRGDPISTYVDENYGSHFVDDPATVDNSLRRL